MRDCAPQSFQVNFDGPDGSYQINFRPIDEWDGKITVSINGHEMVWPALNVELEAAGGLVLGGMTSGSDVIWNDQFWFELRLNDSPPAIRYWGDRVIWREDFSPNV